MQQKVNAHRRELELAVGNKVLVKLQPYYQFVSAGPGLLTWAEASTLGRICPPGRTGPFSCFNGRYRPNKQETWLSLNVHSPEYHQRS